MIIKSISAPVRERKKAVPRMGKLRYKNKSRCNFKVPRAKMLEEVAPAPLGSANTQKRKVFFF
ncbi:MAG: hypothetical protein D6780_06545 [Candidatus Dadabacteria bacterium]|nr:MAG: hypothetical protein D6780_06545 [Candidatus Dadabacteria bacterium]